MTTLLVTDFGPVGTADDAPTIQAALDAAYALADPAKTDVILPAGLYLLQQRVNIGSYTRLIAYDATIRRNANMTDDLLRCRNVAPVNGYEGEHDWEIVGGTWDGNRYVYTAGWNLMSFGHCRNVTIREATFIRCSGAHNIECNSSQGVWVLDCQFRDAFQGSGASEAMHLDGAYSSGTFPMFGNWDQTPCDDVRIEACSFQDGILDGIGSHTVVAGHPHTLVVIRDCEIHCTGTALKLNGYVDVSVTDCAGVAGLWLVHSSDGQFVASDYDNLPVLFDLTYPPLDPPVGGPEPVHITLYTNDGGSGQHSNLPASPTELWNNTYHRAPVDLTGYTQIRVGGVVKNAGAATSRFGLQYSTDSGATWDWCDGSSGPAFSVAATGPKVSAWVTLVGAAAADVWLRPVGVDGNAVADPGIGSLYVEAR